MKSPDEVTKSPHHSTCKKRFTAMSHLEKTKPKDKTKRRKKTKPPKEDNSGKKKTQQTRERNLNYGKPKLLTRRGETNQNPHLTKGKERKNTPQRKT